MKLSLCLSITLVVAFCCVKTRAGQDLYHIIIKCGPYSKTHMENLILDLQETFKVTIKLPHSDWIDLITVRLNDTSLEYVRSLPYVDTVELVRPVIFDCTTQRQADWGLRRISGNNKAANTYEYKHNGSDVTIYVVDTGINLMHNEFRGRATFGTCVHKSVKATADVLDHGTAVAALAIGIVSGVAKEARVVSVRVANDTGHTDTLDLFRGLEWVKDDYIRRANLINITEKQLCSLQPKIQRRTPKSIVNLSLSVGATSSLTKLLIQRLFQCGINVVTSAGNDKTDACNVSPANVEEAITVACTDSNDDLCGFSNYGRCVTMLAPGFNIHSASNRNKNVFKAWHGTSFSAAFVTGVAALFASSKNFTPSPQEIKEWLISQATETHCSLHGQMEETPICLVHSDCSERIFNQSMLACSRSKAKTTIYVNHVSVGFRLWWLLFPLFLSVFIILLCVTVTLLLWRRNTNRINCCLHSCRVCIRPACCIQRCEHHRITSISGCLHSSTSSVSHRDAIAEEYHNPAAMNYEAGASLSQESQFGIDETRESRRTNSNTSLMDTTNSSPRRTHGTTRTYLLYNGGSPKMIDSAL